jgi:hypothetical protein
MASLSFGRVVVVELAAGVLVVDSRDSGVVVDDSSESTEVGEAVVEPASSEFAEHALMSPTTRHAAISRLTLHMTTQQR